MPSRTPIPSFDPEVRQRYLDAGWWRDRTFLDDFDEVVTSQPDKAAIVSTRVARAAHPEVVSYRQLGDYSARFARKLAALGVRRGDVVSIQLPNDWRFAAMVLACARIGAISNPLVPILRERELRYVLGLAEPKVLVIPDRFRGHDYVAMINRVLKHDEMSTRVFAVGLDAPVEQIEPFDGHFLAEPGVVDAGVPATEHIGPDEVVELQFTSGTTGEPKGVMHTPNTIWAGMRVYRELGMVGTDDVVMMPSTLGHQTGFLIGIVLPLSLGMKVVYQDIWDPRHFCELADREGGTFSVGATTFVTDIVEVCRRRGRRLAAMRSYVSAGAPIPSSLVSMAQEHAFEQLFALFGMTENGAVTITRPGDPIEVVSGSDGQPVEWMEVKVVDETGAQVSPGSVGRLLVRGASQCVGYFERPNIYSAHVTDDGDGLPWFDTGDLAARRADGGIRIAGRAKDLIVRGGENIPVVEVEALLFAHPAIREVALVGYPDARLGERACAFVVADVGLELADLTAWLEQSGTAKQFWPERLELVDELPKTASGKVQKHILRAAAAR